MSNESKENSNMHDHTNAAASHDRAYPPGQEDSHAVRYWLGQSDGNKRAGRRNTLGSLARLGLVEYHNGWRATDAGREAYVANIKDTP